MPQPDFPAISQDTDLDGVKDYLYMFRRRLNDFLAHMDTLNIDELNANVIIANTITADKMNVSQLSAIAADLGTITAGSITTNANINVGTDARIGNILYLKETDSSGTKGVIFDTNTGTSAEIEVLSGDMAIRSDGFITMTIGSSQGLVVNKKITGTSLHANNGASGTFYVASSSGGATNTQVTVVNGIIISIV